MIINCAIIDDEPLAAGLLKSYADTFNFMELSKLAIDYSDGVIAAQKGVKKELLKYAEEHEKPTLKYPGEDFGDAYAEFYETL